jgi:hypothetical protein
MKKLIIIGVIALFVGLGFQPALAIEPVISTYIFKEGDIEPKDYLFETVIEIANNPEVRELFDEYGYNIFNFNYDYNGIYRQIFLNNPKLLSSLINSKPKMTIEYLNFAYYQGCDIVNIIGEYKALIKVKSVKISNPEIFNVLNSIIVNNEELSNRISTLEIMNTEVKPDKPFEDNPIICAISWLCLIPVYISAMIFIFLEYTFKDFPMLSSILHSFGFFYAEISLFFLALIMIFDCFRYNMYGQKCYDDIEQIIPNNFYWELI